jgi:hypothetical protein
MISGVKKKDKHRGKERYEKEGERERGKKGLSSGGWRVRQV